MGYVVAKTPLTPISYYYSLIILNVFTNFAKRFLARVIFYDEKVLLFIVPHFVFTGVSAGVPVSVSVGYGV